MRAIRYIVDIYIYVSETLLLLRESDVAFVLLYFIEATMSFLINIGGTALSRIYHSKLSLMGIFFFV